MTQILKKLGWSSAVLGLALSTVILSTSAVAQYPDQGQGQNQQDQRDDPPSRVARIGYLEGSVSFQPAGETDWVQAVPNRPITTGDKLWSDRDSRAELQLGSAVIRVDANTGFSFLNLDDNTVQIQLTSGSVNVRVRRLDQNDVFEIDTPNLAFSISQPGNYRLTASEDGSNTVVSIRDGGGQSTGNGQTYTLHSGQSGTFSGTDSLNADVVDIRGPDQFDQWADQRDRRFDDSRSSQYVSHEVVGYEDLDHYGDWRDDSNYGHVWFPNQVAVGWAPYHNGHWEWIPPWGYTWVDDSPWGYAPFHYGRWVTVGGRWGWIAGPVAVRPVYAPALVVFIGGGGGFAGNVGWFPLGPREVYVPSYPVSRGYVNRVNVSNTTVNNTTITNVYNTTIINNKTTNVTNVNNVTYVNRNVRGAVTAVPQRSFATAQPVARSAVAVNARQIAAAPVSARVAVAPTRESVLGARAATANRVTTPPPAVMNRQVIAKATPPPPPVSFARQQQALAAHPGQPLARREVQNLRPAAAAEAHPMVKQAPPGNPATPTMGRPGNQPGNQPNAAQPAAPAVTAPANQPANHPGSQPVPNEHPGVANPAQPNRPPSAQPNPPAPAQPNNRPEANQPNNRPEANRPPSAQPIQPVPNNRPDTNRPPTAPTDNRPNQQNRQPDAIPQPNRPPSAQPVQPVPNTQPGMNRPTAAPPNRAQPSRNQAAPGTSPPSDRPQQRPPVQAAPVPRPQPQQSKPLTPEEKKRQEEQRKREQQQPPGQ